MRFFEVKLPVWVREVVYHRQEQEQFPDLPTASLMVTVHMGDNATPEDAVKALAEQLEKLCNDSPPYSGG
jgi:hypothetical protein